MTLCPPSSAQANIGIPMLSGKKPDFKGQAKSQSGKTKIAEFASCHVHLSCIEQI
jgi:hypothetical protein